MGINRCVLLPELVPALPNFVFDTRGRVEMPVLPPIKTHPYQPLVLLFRHVRGYSNPPFAHKDQHISSADQGSLSAV